MYTLFELYSKIKNKNIYTFVGGGSNGRRIGRWRRRRWNRNAKVLMLEYQRLEGAGLLHRPRLAAGFKILGLWLTRSVLAQKRFGRFEVSPGRFQLGRSLGWLCGACRLVRLARLLLVLWRHGPGGELGILGQQFALGTVLVLATADWSL
jgi:hypothetical protein